MARLPSDPGHAMKSARGLTLVETLAAMLIMALLALAVASGAKVILGTDREAACSWRATELGLALLEEVTAMPFDDPQTSSPSLAPDFSEWIPLGDRVLFDDVDDYTIWNGSQGLQQKDGTPIDLPAYTRSVSVVYVDPDDFSIISLQPTDYKRITVSVLEHGQLVRSFVTVRVQGGRHVDCDG